MRRLGSRWGRSAGRWTGLVALASGVVMVLASCSSKPPVVVTETITPGAGQVTVASLPTSTPDEPSSPTTTGSTDGGATTAGKTADKTAGKSKSTTKPPSTTSKPPAPKVRVTANPKFGSKNVGPNQPVSVTSFNATIDHVEMIGDDGTSINGKVVEDGHTWKVGERLRYGVTYSINGTTKAADGSTKPFQGKITTVDPKKTMAAYIQIPDGKTVGIAAPIIVTFAGSVADRAAAERQLKVTTKNADGKPITVEGSWGWIPDEDIQGNGVMQSRVHFRPKEYWPAHTQVHVQADLYGVNYGDGAWGREDLTRDFKIGDDVVVKADVDSYHLVVLRDGKVLRNYPVSYGKPSDPGRNTVSGIHVITDHEGDPETGAFTMCNPKYGYCGVTEYWGVRINNNGEFIHANKETEAAGLLGKENVSHGCVNMSMTDAKEFYDFAIYGMPVEVTGTGVEMDESDYIWDWAPKYAGDSGWANWKALSAL